MIGRDKLRKFTPGSLHFFFSLMGGSEMKFIDKQVAQAPERLALRVIGREEEFERMTVSHQNNTN